MGNHMIIKVYCSTLQTERKILEKKIIKKTNIITGLAIGIILLILVDIAIFLDING
jgi:hypothetical protein